MIDFGLLYAHPISTPCALWSRCDSHCCHIGAQVRPFDAETDLAVLPIPEVELAYLREIGAPDEQWPDQARTLDLEIGDYALRVYMQPCNLGGRCESSLRPTICRVYPYIPLVDDDLRVSATINATAFDLVWREPSEDPCLMRGGDESRRHLAQLDDLVARLATRSENLEILLWFNLAFRYLAAFREYLSENSSGDEGVPLQERFHAFYLCNTTQLFLATPEFRAALEGEVERYHRWRSDGAA